MIIPFFESKRQYKELREELNESINKVLSSGWYVLGKENQNFEKNFASFIGTKLAVGVNSGTDALKIALKAVGVGPGDEVITVSNTAVPTVSAIRETGAKPVFVDVDKYFTLDAEMLKEKITQRTKVIVPVHLYGGVCNMEAIMKIARKYRLKVVEDCAQAVGAKYNNKKVGTFGDISCFSFYPTKNLGALGDGGIILTSNKKLADKCRALRMYGMENSYHSKVEGYNSRLDEMQASILSTKLPHLNTWNKRRQEIARMYIKGIKNPHISLPEIRPGSEHVFHLFVIRTSYREKLINHLSKWGISSKVHYPYPIHLQEGYSFLKNQSRSLKVTERIADEILSLPIFPELKDSEIKYVIRVLNKFSIE